MAVYAVCTSCGMRRQHCLDQSKHKAFVEWTADVQFSRTSNRLRKTFSKKELADVQERQWRTDYERGLLLPKNDAPQVTFSQVAAEWENMIIGQRRIKNYHRGEQYRVRAFVNRFGSRLISSLTLNDGEEWMTERVNKKLEINTINREVKPLKWIMNYAVTKGHIKSNPFDMLKEIKKGNVRVRWMTQAEVQKLVETAIALKDLDLVDVIMIGINTGFRKGNLERLSAKDINNNMITAVKTKSNKPYDVPITQSIVPVLKRLIGLYPTQPFLKTSKLDSRFREVSKAAGFYKSKKDPDKVTLHTLRHTFAALYLKRGGDIYKLSKLLGHSSVGITERVYGHICPKDLAAQAPLINTEINLSPHVLSHDFQEHETRI